MADPKFGEGLGGVNGFDAADGMGGGGGLSSGPDDFPALPLRARDPVLAAPSADRTHFDRALAHPAVAAVNITYKGLHICGPKLRGVSQAVDFVTVQLGTARASYYPDLDRVRVPALSVQTYGSRDARGQREADGQAVHEMVHAVQDQARWSLQLWEVEGTAYVAQMIYLHVRRIAEDPSCPVEHDLRNPIRIGLARTAHAVAEAAGCLSAPGRLVALSEAALSPMVAALARIPGIGPRLRQPVTGQDGLAGAGCAQCSCADLPR